MKNAQRATEMDADEVLFPVLISCISLLEIYQVNGIIHQVTVTIHERVMFHEPFGPIGGKVIVNIPPDIDQVLSIRQVMPAGSAHVIVIGKVSIPLF